MSISSRTSHWLAITAGEPAGIGPDLLVQRALQSAQARFEVVYADAQVLQTRAAALGLSISLREFTGPDMAPAEPGEMVVRHLSCAVPVVPGQLDARNANYVLQTLTQAVLDCRAGLVAGMVTCPVHKGIINEAGTHFSGHTEFLQELLGVEQVVMMLATEGLRVALVTTHLPLREVADALTRDTLERVLRIVDHDMRVYFGVQTPKLYVCGLNPHAGEGGHLGREELDVMQPCMNALRAEGVELIGPLPADTIFSPSNLADADAFVAMYHDQGLPVLKYKGFGAAVNITLGLPIIRTSVDHGTALDLVGTGRADMGSLRVAIQYARHMASSRSEI